MFLLVLVAFLAQGGAVLAANSDLRATDSSGPVSGVVGGSVTGQSFTITNLGPDPATNVTVTLTLPSFVSVAADQGYNGPSCNGNICTFGSLGVNQYILALIRLDGDSPGSGTITYTVSADQTDPNPNNNAVSRSVHVLVTALAQTHSSPTSALRNTAFDLVLTVTNAGPGSAENVTVAQRLHGWYSGYNYTADVALDFVSAVTSTGAPCTTAPGSIPLPGGVSSLAVVDVTCTVGALANPGDSATVTIRTKWNGSEQLHIDPAYATATEAAGTTAYWSLIQIGFTDVDVSGVLEHTTVQVGDTFTYTVTGHNNGDLAKNVRTHTSFDQAVGFLSSSLGTCTFTATYSTVDCTLGDIPNGGTYTIALTLKAVSVSSLTTFTTSLGTDSQQTVTTNDRTTTWLRITVCTPITVTPATPPQAVRGVPYLQTFAASGGVSPYVFAASGTLPPGLALNGNSLQGTPTASGTFTFTITATDRNSCTGSVVSTLAVIADEEPPSITPPPATTFGTDQGCGYAGSIGTATAVDNVTLAKDLVITNDAPAVFPIGMTTVTWRATDAAGNSATATQDVTIVDDDPPAITAPASIEVGANVGATYIGPIGTPAASDNCSSGATLVVTNDAPSSFSLGTTTVTWKATDAAGNQTAATQQVTIIDDQPPVIVAPAAINVGTNTGCTYTGAIGTPAATDNVSSDPQLRITSNAPASFPTGATTVTWTATDAAGNSASATQLVTVNDDDPPTIVVPADVMRFADGSGGAIVTRAELDTATAADNCLVTSVRVAGLPAGDYYPIGTTTITWTAVDAAANATSDTQLVTVLYGICPLYDPAKSWKVGATIPIKLKLCATNQTNLSSPSITLHAVEVVRLEGTASAELDDAGNANPDFDFRYDAALGGYIFNLKTTGYAAGRYTLRFTVNGQTGYGAGFQVR